MLVELEMLKFGSADLVAEASRHGCHGSCQREEDIDGFIPVQLRYSLREVRHDDDFQQMSAAKG